ncbi:MAG: preprotein translocase subunit SecA, partial [Gammaproteobacteria bacterium]|nr:preprotein translocase subunit SecA [Gammaproteobacteria bacterium]
TLEFKEQINADEKSLDELLPEAFAVVREASCRVMEMRHFDEQMLGGITLHQGRIAEMRTGEGKTLVATLPVYLNALAGGGVHVVTVNDYLAQRDASWMAPLYEFLGLKVGVVTSNQDPEKKRTAYESDVVYGTNNEFGFDYLRDNMAFSKDMRYQRDLSFAVVDEVDSILIDEARTPLIISGQSEDSSELYRKINTLIPKLTQQPFVEKSASDESIEDTGHYAVDEKSRNVELTELGHEYVEDLLAGVNLLQEGESLYAPTNLNLFHHVHSAIKAYALFHRDVDYIVQDNEIVIVDEHTGRTMPGRRWSDGIHQAVEAKEMVHIQNESQTLASTTFQNYFRLYDKLSGMTGTADTEAFEFRQIYGLDVVVVPTHKAMTRKDLNDLIYLTTEEKYAAISEDIQEAVEAGRPVLVGTASVETSEYISNLLKKQKVNHQVLNAKFHEKEADIIAQAGQPGRVTIATNMAGRGTDIKLGGNWEVEVAKLDNPSEAEVAAIKAAWQDTHDKVLAAGGLQIIGTERHESRRIDNQLRGRSGRQGDPGISRFYLSLEDNLMRIFASDKVKSMMQGLGMEKGEAIEHRWVSRSIENAQRKVEGRNFDMRKSLLEYDDVANDQRHVVYQQRNDMLDSDDISEAITDIRSDVLNETIDDYIPPQSIDEQWDIPGLETALEGEFRLQTPVQQWLDDEDTLNEEGVREKILGHLVGAYATKEETVGGEVFRQLEKQVMLEVLDRHWKEHLANMDHLRQGIHLRGYAQKNPKHEYKRESFELFQGMLTSVQHEVIRILSSVELRSEDEVEALEKQRMAQSAEQKMDFNHSDAEPVLGPQSGGAEDTADKAQTFVRDERKVGRNEPCPCGSGKKYKQCHGKLD